MKRVLALARGWLAFGILGTAMMYSTCLADTVVSQPDASGGGGVSGTSEAQSQTVGGAVSDGTGIVSTVSALLSPDHCPKFKIVWATEGYAPHPTCPLYPGTEGQYFALKSIGPDDKLYDVVGAVAVWDGIGECGMLTDFYGLGAVVRPLHPGTYRPSAYVFYWGGDWPENCPRLQRVECEDPAVFNTPIFEDFGTIRSLEFYDYTSSIQYDPWECGDFVEFDGGWIHRDSRVDPITLRGSSVTMGLNPESGSTCSDCQIVGRADYEEFYDVPQAPGAYPVTFPLVEDLVDNYNEHRGHPSHAFATEVIRNDRHCTVYQVGVDDWLQPAYPRTDPPFTEEIEIGCRVTPGDVVWASPGVLDYAIFLEVWDPAIPSHSNSWTYWEADEGSIRQTWDGKLFDSTGTPHELSACDYYMRVTLLFDNKVGFEQAYGGAMVFEPPSNSDCDAITIVESALMVNPIEGVFNASGILDAANNIEGAAAAIKSRLEMGEQKLQEIKGELEAIRALCDDDSTIDLTLSNFMAFRNFAEQAYQNSLDMERMSGAFQELENIFQNPPTDIGLINTMVLKEAFLPIEVHIPFCSTEQNISVTLEPATMESTGNAIVEIVESPSGSIPCGTSFHVVHLKFTGSLGVQNIRVAVGDHIRLFPVRAMGDTEIQKLQQLQTTCIQAKGKLEGSINMLESMAGTMSDIFDRCKQIKGVISFVVAVTPNAPYDFHNLGDMISAVMDSVEGSVGLYVSATNKACAKLNERIEAICNTGNAAAAALDLLLPEGRPVGGDEGDGSYNMCSTTPLIDT